MKQAATAEGGHQEHAISHDNPKAEPIRPTLSPAARRALAEAEQRRRRIESDATSQEIGGRGGLDPVRFGDWEVKGIISDF